MTHLKVSCESRLRKKLLQENLLKLLAKVLRDTLVLQVEQQKFQVKSGVASWVLLYCECRFNLTKIFVIKHNIMFLTGQ